MGTGKALSTEEMRLQAEIDMPRWKAQASGEAGRLKRGSPQRQVARLESGPH